MASHQEREEAQMWQVVKHLLKAIPEADLRMMHVSLICGIWVSLRLGWIPMDRGLDFFCLALLIVLIARPLIYDVRYRPRDWLSSHLNHEAKSVEQNVQKHGAVETYGMSLCDTKLSVEQHVQKYGAVETYQMENGGTVLICSKHGRNLWLGYINVIINASERGQSWGGSFSVQHLKVKGKHYMIQMVPTCPGTYGNLLLDLSKLAKLLIMHFKDGNHGPISHVQELFDSMTNPPDGLISSERKQPKFLKYLKNHSALKTTRQRKLFIADLCQAYRAMGQTEKDKFDNAMSNVVVVGDWRKVASENALLNRVLTYRGRDAKIKYNNGAHDLFRFLRNFQEHGGDREDNGQQIINDLQDLEFIAVQKYAKFIADLIYELVMELDMAGLLEYGWKNYIES